MRAEARLTPGERRLAWTLAALFALSAALLAFNAATRRYTWICYFPRELWPALPFALQGLWIGARARARHPRFGFILVNASLYGLLMIALAAIVTGIQVTPFGDIDDALLRADRALGFDTPALLAWTAERPWLRQALRALYVSTDLQLALVPALPILAQDERRTRAFMDALLWAIVAGALFYWLFPSSGPAGRLDSPFFEAQQRATHMKFLAVHERLPVTTIVGGMIAFPSFHVAWSVLLPYAAWGRPRWFWPLAALNLAVIASTLLLGWHYLVDVPAGLLLAALGIAATEAPRPKS